jgi:mRNA-degrading endonuclease YafQ of YafQ-DinJ toxin-antitoxin module
MYDIKYTSRFKKDYKRLKKRGWVLIYFKSESTLVLSMTRTGTHSDVF